eukprot:TRINITY_DN8580_c0_g1_i1.p1 TRINITY_DN8580_c0_g1~~TRINITY_DN8580_c0_g1_i1.p1  ORF type:complete len:103 (+),score=18.37 TRINITY_DN8580_c0_g1_i1:59-367(+)
MSACAATMDAAVAESSPYALVPEMTPAPAMASQPKQQSASKRLWRRLRMPNLQLPLRPHRPHPSQQNVPPQQPIIAPSCKQGKSLRSPKMLLETLLEKLKLR